MRVKCGCDRVSVIVVDTRELEILIHPDERGVMV